ncbi:hypothetical protein [Candidatus Nesciobacter abundans]|uniref:BamA/TamA family outer membrane protein n=1 Tax=Candidatus Nesciobacter abundans TaxID=2601668 RepID=A0A5C0UFM1_9PROT|nr:hypothetical protein [Candidatus Nesciobacter abundans]QEK38858.1 hypothetical protein FZC36_00160 [Candidatus Nesciobacter abundans]
MILFLFLICNAFSAAKSVDSNFNPDQGIDSKITRSIQEISKDLSSTENVSKTDSDKKVDQSLKIPGKVQNTKNKNSQLSAQDKPNLSSEKSNAVKSSPKIEVIGNGRTERDFIVGIAKSFIKSMDFTETSKIKNKLLESGYFSDVIVTKKNKNVIQIRVVENPILKSIKYKGSISVEDSMWEVITGLRPKRIVSLKDILIAKARIIRELEALPDSELEEIKIMQKTDKNSIDLIFDIKTRPKKTIDSILFVGNKNIPSGDLYANLEKSSSLFLYVFPRAHVMESEEKQKESLERYAKSKGYFDFRVKSIVCVDINKSRQMTINLEEGKRYKIKSVELNMPNNLKKYFDIKIGQYYEESDIFDRKKKAKCHLYEKQEFSKDIDVKTSQSNGEVEIRFFLTEESSRNVGLINIYGNERTYSEVILRRMRLEPGDKVSERSFAISKAKIASSGFSELADIDVMESEENLSDVKVSFKEADTGKIMASLGLDLGSYFSWNVGFGYQDLNMFGLGKKFNGSFVMKKNKASLNLDLAESYYNSGPFTKSYQLMFGLMDRNHSNYLLARSRSSFPIVFDFGTKADKGSLNFSTLSKELSESGYSDKNDDLEKSKDIGLDKDWSESEEGITFNKPGAEFKRNYSVSLNNLTTDLGVGGTLDYFTLKDTGDLTNTKRGVGIPRFYDKDHRKFDKIKYSVSGHADFTYGISNDNFGLKIHSANELSLGSSIFLKSILSGKLFAEYNDYGVVLSARCGKIFHGSKYSWIDNFKASESGVSGFKEFGPRELISYSTLGGTEMFSFKGEVFGPLLAKKIFEISWFSFFSIGSLCESSIKEKLIPNDLAKKRRWGNVADIVNNKRSLVSSVGTGLIVKFGRSKVRFSINYPVLGRDSSFNAIESFSLNL